MSKLAVFTSLFALIVMTGICQKRSMAQSPWQQSTLNENKFSIDVGAKIFDRPETGQNVPFVFDGTTNALLFDNDQATDFGADFGVEIKVNIPGRFDRGLEFRTVLANWEQDNTVNGANLFSPTFFPDPQDPFTTFTPPQTFFFDIESDYYSFELMRKRDVRPGLTLSVGPRFIATSDRIFLTNFTDGATTQSNDYEAKNSLIGLQTGIEINRPVAQAVNVTLFGRVGGYYNGTRFDIDATATGANGTPPTIAGRRTRSTESLVAELGGRVNFNVLPNGITTYVGYEATVIDGIALSSENFNNPGRIDTNNTLFFQAITLGATLSY